MLWSSHSSGTNEGLNHFTFLYVKFVLPLFFNSQTTMTDYLNITCFTLHERANSDIYGDFKLKNPFVLLVYMDVF